ncbi:MAG: PQQ-dependent sugar dehydrogenase [Hyphomonadaceae bacterium]|nr:PQQ-dependent sugar dehydrogenase [Hyphomonadaceae bacterium]
MTRLWFSGIALSGTLLLTGCGGGGGGGGGNPPPANRAPAFTSAASVSVAENVTGAFYTATATDPDGNALTYSISGGADAARFTINANPGALSFLTPPDFEAPTDANGDNIYLVTLSVSDGQLSAALNLTVSVTNQAGGIRARLVASGFSAPIFLTALPDGSGRVFVVERAGRVRIFNPATGATQSTAFLDLTGTIAIDGERGLLGLALAPNFSSSGAFYIFVVNTAGAIEIRRYQSSGGVANAGSGDVILAIPHPRTNHLGGWIGFGPNGLLYIATGDGGGSGDPDGNGQNPNTLLGKILRIDVNSDAFPSDPSRDYAIPSTNPFATSGGAPEVWLWGLRNPFRNGFDRANGNLYIGDVGQDAIEEISLARPSDGGRNYGWNILEGTRPFAGGSTVGLTPPVLEYPHGTAERQGNSVTGGYVYRGPIASLQGTYVFGDFIRRRVFSVPASSFNQGSTLNNTQFTERTTEWAPTGPATIGNVVSFGEDQSGALYIVDFDGDIFRLDEVD